MIGVMHCTVMEKTYGGLKRDINSCNDLLKEAAILEPALEGYQSWQEIHELDKGEQLKASAKNRIAKSIIKARMINSDPRWNIVLMLLYWPILGLIYQLRAKYSSDEEELWQNICLNFLKIVNSPNLTSKKGNISGIIFYRASASLRDHYQSLWRKSKREVYLDTAEWEILTCGCQCCRSENDYHINLCFIRRRKIISQAEYEVLAGGMRLGLTPQEQAALSKRRQRATIKIKKYLNNPVLKSTARPQIITWKATKPSRRRSDGRRVS